MSVVCTSFWEKYACFVCSSVSVSFGLYRRHNHVFLCLTFSLSFMFKTMSICELHYRVVVRQAADFSVCVVL